MLSLLPLLISTFVGSIAEVYLAHAEYRKQYRARKMIRSEAQVPGQALLSRSGATTRLPDSTSPAAAGTQRNPSQGGQPWLSKKELLRLYQQRGLLPTLPAVPTTSAPTSAPGAHPSSFAAAHGSSNSCSSRQAASGSGESEERRDVRNDQESESSPPS
ncbi:hypothetical protein GUITHDRAFT_151253 [Guillardia theta CCMP2712]|uniref:Uncharacterized protein n=2 Tax=Guillardia theta TaxID=55529 RepID=L1JP41_GUITC|nr:hypothetical protein GUITHDRAFT_151253 [Guillardia theta CCMP2712]EKX50227.1 hypothetical protein GUITHDRAFT_151253 [Guillardia theta CCMP2712]|eukprot:XP_005837207.1 hypothetical protein GUITHDRAFT_151253 [Guillardia theta CCMP2712]